LYFQGRQPCRQAAPSEDENLIFRIEGFAYGKKKRPLENQIGVSGGFFLVKERRFIYRDQGFEFSGGTVHVREI